MNIDRTNTRRLQLSGAKDHASMLEVRSPIRFGDRRYRTFFWSSLQAAIEQQRRKGLECIGMF